MAWVPSRLRRSSGSGGRRPRGRPWCCSSRWMSINRSKSLTFLQKTFYLLQLSVNLNVLNWKFLMKCGRLSLHDGVRNRNGRKVSSNLIKFWWKMSWNSIKSKWRQMSSPLFSSEPGELSFSRLFRKLGNRRTTEVYDLKRSIGTFKNVEFSIHFSIYQKSSFAIWSFRKSI